MRRRWKLLVAVGAVTLLVGVIFIMPDPGADLEWIRRLGPIRETVGKTRVEEQMWGSFTTVERRFDFAGDEPSAAMIDAVNANNLARDVSNRKIGLPHNWDRDDASIDYKTISIVYRDAIPLPRWRRWMAWAQNLLGVK